MARRSENNSIISPFHWSSWIIVMTCITLAILIGTLTYLYFTPKPPASAGYTVLNYAIISIVLIAVFVSIGSTPKSLRIDDDGIKLSKLAGSVEIPMTIINSIDVIPSNILSGSIRIFGSGGFFGYLGRFRNRKVGRYTLFATEMKNLLIVKTYAKTYIFSCRKGELFKDFFNHRQAA